MKREETCNVAEKIHNWPKRSADRNAMILVTVLYFNFGYLDEKILSFIIFIFKAFFFFNFS